MLSVDIKKTFSGFSLDVSFEADDDALALLGASGCGKSMTLKCIAGIIKPDSGRIVLNNRVLFDSQKRINLCPQKRKTGLLFQNYALFPNMTVEENITAALRRTTVSDKQKRLNELLETFFLSPQRAHYPGQLSGGQQQRAALARILASEPEIIMLDEPLSALDSFLRWHLEQELIDVIEKFSGTVLYVSHNRDEVYRICKKICVINNGKSEEIMTAQEFFESPKTRPAALLSGCKNFSRAKKIAHNKVFASDWNCELDCGEVSDDVRHIGVRAHNIILDREYENPAANTIVCTIEKIVQDVFTTIVIALPKETGAQNKNRDAQNKIRVELSKQTARKFCAGDTVELGILPDDIMPLR